ncbi:hypothetical protein [Sandarakinorhabdus glacialis]|nr:hypothetical protein [Polymorphobacter glacialis]
MTLRKDHPLDKYIDDPRSGMSPKEGYEWEWNALPRWVKATCIIIGGPAFAVLVWSVFDQNAIDGRTRAICFVLSASVSLLQIFSLHKVTRTARRGKK